MGEYSGGQLILLALLATLGTWFVTALGAGLVLFTKRLSQKYLDASLGMAAGVMIAASFWSLLSPAIEMSERLGPWRWLPALVGFLLGAGALLGIDRILPHIHPGLAVAEGPKTSWQRSTLLVLAITLHNIPEGLAVGVAFGAVLQAGSGLAGPQEIAAAQAKQMGAAVALAVGIGLQNFPEGTAVSLPLRREGMSRRRAFWYGQLSAVVEPVGGVAGAAAVLLMKPILPYALAFAAGAMIFVVAEELIPEAQRKGNVDLATISVILGFAVMMTLDVALG
ncbi:MAG: dihydroorotate dehydrogenase [Phycisphaerae bacterium SM23_33]|jgi:ZIP family zinc transporter|nr:MAG: dihydroorotate dehydrogenase [Phycisphaerae bacterium SM23_33]